jgi:hypothetical protein
MGGSGAAAAHRHVGGIGGNGRSRTARSSRAASMAVRRDGRRLRTRAIRNQPEVGDVGIKRVVDNKNKSCPDDGGGAANDDDVLHALSTTASACQQQQQQEEEERYAADLCCPPHAALAAAEVPRRRWKHLLAASLVTGASAVAQLCHPAGAFARGKATAQVPVDLHSPAASFNLPVVGLYNLNAADPIA